MSVDSSIDRSAKTAEAPATILVVCTANICRSPVVEAILRQRLEAAGLGHWRVRSAGTLAQPGLLASEHSIAALADRGLDISGHRSQVVERPDVAAADLVLCMEAFHVGGLRAEFPEHARRIFLLTEMVGRDEDVRDPYGGPRPWYEVMVEEVTGLVEHGLERIVALARRGAGRPDRKLVSASR